MHPEKLPIEADDYRPVAPIRCRGLPLVKPANGHRPAALDLSLQVEAPAVAPEVSPQAQGPERLNLSLSAGRVSIWTPETGVGIVRRDLLPEASQHGAGTGEALPVALPTCIIELRLKRNGQADGGHGGTRCRVRSGCPHRCAGVQKKNGALAVPEAPSPLIRNTMTQPRKQPTAACVSVYDTEGDGQNSGPDRVSGATRSSASHESLYSEPESSQASLRRSAFGEKQPPAGIPVTRGPYDCWHTEAYLIGWLVKGHGWRVLEPGVIVRPTAAAPCSLELG